ncbi:MAG: hypothetical protein WCW84_14385 [Sulfurimonas sp.]|jgi:hypothetical protein
MYWNIFYMPLYRIGEKVNVAITTFESDEESVVRELFEKTYVGTAILSTASHWSRELAYKQVYDMGDIIEGHDDFHLPKRMCKECGLMEPSGLSDDGLCIFCHDKPIEMDSIVW